PTAVVARRLQAEPLELRRDVAQRQLAAARRRRAPFEEVVGQKAHVRGERGRGDVTGSALFADGEGGGQRGSGSEDPNEELIHARLVLPRFRDARRRRGGGSSAKSIVAARASSRSARTSSSSAAASSRCCLSGSDSTASITRSCDGEGARSRRS